MLRHCSLETRTNLWQLMCRPLLEQAMVLAEAEQSKTNLEAVLCAVRNTFRRMTLLKKNVEIGTINTFIRYDFLEKSTEAVEKARAKWRYRTNRRKLTLEEEIRMEEEEKTRSMKTIKKEKNLMPKELVEYTNLLTAKCTKCKGGIIRTSHLLSKHAIDVPEPSELWTILQKMVIQKWVRTSRNERKQVILRKETIALRAEFIQNYIETVVLFLDQQ